MVKIRRAYEVLFLGLFLFFLLITDLRYLKGWPVSLFLEATPLVAVSTALTTHTIYRNLVWGLVIIAVTMMLGRVWCNWMCPFGILHHFFGWIGNRRNTKQMIEVNRYRKIYAIKYYILAAMLAMASLWIIPTLVDAPGQIVKAYREIAGRPRRLPRPGERSSAWSPGRRWLFGLGHGSMRSASPGSSWVRSAKFRAPDRDARTWLGVVVVAVRGLGSWRGRVAVVRRRRRPASARRPRSTRPGRAPSRSACSTRSR